MPEPGGRAPGHRPRKRFGQHFLHDRAAINRILDALQYGPADRVIEIGPGRGALTFPLLGRVGELEVIEIDRDLAAGLEAGATGPGRLTVHCGDVLKFDFCAGGGRVRVLGNLPYNITTPLLFHLLDQRECLLEMVLMMQKEVAERLCAGPGGKDYGRLSVMVQSCCRAEYLFTVGSGAFTPPPRVESAVVRLLPEPGPGTGIADRSVFADLVSRAFTQRRKTLRRSLKGLLTAGELERLAIDPGTRPECLPLEAFVAMANHVARRARAG